MDVLIFIGYIIEVENRQSEKVIKEKSNHIAEKYIKSGEKGRNVRYGIFSGRNRLFPGRFSGIL